MSYTFAPIGLIHSPYKEKFGIPRQPDLAPSGRVTLELLPPYNQPDCVRGLEVFSHLWLTFVFHQTAERGWQPLVRPPRLGGNAKVGVFASRSTHRPNPLGLSLVRLVDINHSNGVCLTLGGADLMDGTPVLDIKPYIPFVEARHEASGGFAETPPPALQVDWSEDALLQLAALPAAPAGLAALVDEVLAQDPRPAYQDDPERVYGVRLYDYNIRFRIVAQCAEVLEILPA
jgi:tRNA-Thr(GGU) m(6)t(6)A37 methyltransferase TsaA